MELKEWHDFLVAAVGSSAALTGLIFVGVSINITRILSFEKLPDRALLSIILLLNNLVVSLLLLMPKQSYLVVATEVLALEVCVYSFVTKLDIGIYRKTGSQYRKQYAVTMIYNQVSLLPCLTAGAAIFIWKENGMYWLALGMTISLIKAVVDAWVLLVEINR